MSSLFRTPLSDGRKSDPNGAAAPGPNRHLATPANYFATVEPPGPPTAGEELQIMKQALLNPLDRFFVDRKLRGDARELVGALARDMIRAQHEVIEHRILLGVAREKKTLLIEGMAQSAKVDDEIIELSAKFARDLQAFVHDGGLEIWIDLKTRLDRLDAARDAGQITEDAHAAERAFLERDSKNARDNLDVCLGLFLKSHYAQLDRTLKLFDQQQLRIESI
jgi:hypothetical protein